jgi:hypothetical protein
MDRLAQIIAPNHVPTRSKFELFDAQTGCLRIKEFYKLSTPTFKYTKGEAVLIRSTDQQTWDMQIALNLKFQGAQEERSAYLDEDEIRTLGTALVQMRDNHAAIVRDAKTYTEVTYTSRGGVSAGFYVHEDKSSEGFIAIAGESAFLQNLTELEKVIDEALFKIEMIRRPG